MYCEETIKTYRYECDRFTRYSDQQRIESGRNNLRRDLGEYLRGIAMTCSKNRFYQVRAALCWGLNQGIPAESPGSLRAIWISRSIAYIRHGIGSYRQIREGLEPKRRKSKVSGSRKKKVDIAIIKEMHGKSDSREKAAIELLFSTGIRTCEFIDGVEIAHTGDSLYVWVRSRKKSELCSSGSDHFLELNVSIIEDVFGELSLLQYTNSRQIFSNAGTLQRRIRSLRKNVAYGNGSHRIHSAICSGPIFLCMDLEEL